MVFGVVVDEVDVFGRDGDVALRPYFNLYLGSVSLKQSTKTDSFGSASSAGEVKEIGASGIVKR